MCGDDSDLLPKVKDAKKVAVAALVFAILTIVDWAVVAGYSGSQNVFYAYLYHRGDDAIGDLWPMGAVAFVGGLLAIAGNSIATTVTEKTTKPEGAEAFVKVFILNLLAGILHIVATILVGVNFTSASWGGSSNRYKMYLSSVMRDLSSPLVAGTAVAALLELAAAYNSWRARSAIVAGPSTSMSTYTAPRRGARLLVRPRRRRHTLLQGDDPQPGVLGQGQGHRHERRRHGLGVSGGACPFASGGESCRIPHSV